mgnify:CR=1 FL=1
MGIGSASPTGTMAISNTELALITATYDASKAITFESTKGGIEVFGFTQSSVMTNAQTAAMVIKTIAAKDVTFSTAASIIGYLTVTSAGGISLEKKVATVVGALSMTYSAGNLAVGADAELDSAGAMVLTAGSTSYSLAGADPLPIYAAGDLTVSSKVAISGSSGTLEFRSTGTVTLSQTVTSGGAITITGDHGCDGTAGGVVISNTITSTDVTITGGSLVLTGTLSIGAGNNLFSARNDVALPMQCPFTRNENSSEAE